MIKVFDNFLSEVQFEQVEEIVCNPENNWQLLFETSLPGKVPDRVKRHFSNVEEYIQFVHNFYNVKNDKDWRSDCFPAIETILGVALDKLDMDAVELLRCKANFQPRHYNRSDGAHNLPHVDFQDEEHNVLLFYLNNSDGDTYFYDDDNKLIKRVKPMRNRLVAFPGNTLHAGTHPKHNDYRMVINIDYKEQK